MTDLSGLADRLHRKAATPESGVYFDDAIELHTGGSTVIEAGADYCREHGNAIATLLDAAKAEYLLRSRDSGSETDTCAHCDICGTLLAYTLTEAGADDEAEHFTEYPPSLPLSGHEAYHLLELVLADMYGEQHRDLHAKIESWLSGQPAIQVSAWVFTDLHFVPEDPRGEQMYDPKGHAVLLNRYRWPRPTDKVDASHHPEGVTWEAALYNVGAQSWAFSSHRLDRVLFAAKCLLAGHTPNFPGLRKTGGPDPEGDPWE